ncbi:hypothetical protein B0A49_04699 [Cryomyces minteri]|uniref:Pentatricopeptide repeat domain-containing protein n=1 Tax=Cryomyces minteri TaxID=331657 RepID=A0A4U0XSU9_9PEZI|nr:hypothetical protein B0A49_04699 [Cryomyces minteri]
MPREERESAEDEEDVKVRTVLQVFGRFPLAKAELRPAERISEDCGPDPSISTSRRFMFDRMRFESDVATSIGTGNRLVDKLETKNDLELWHHLLEFRKRLDGTEGIRDIWSGMKRRNVDLPISGTHANYMWETFLTAGFEQTDLLESVYKYAVDLRHRKDDVYEPLYESIVGHMLRTKSPHTYGWHRRMLDQYPPREGYVKRLAKGAAHSKNSPGVFKRIYLESDERDVYDTLIISLCDRGAFHEARQWHKYLIKHDDPPSAAMAPKLTMKHIALGYHRQPPVPRHDNAPTINTTARLELRNKRFSREMMSGVVGESHGVAPKELDDAFCARLFATKALSIDFVIRGLGMFGVESIGPMAMRELAGRAQTSALIFSKITALEEAGISIGQSVFSRAVKRAAQGGRTEVLHYLLHSDQHPDVFEDRTLQEELLHKSIAIKDWQQVHRTLVVLTVFHSDPDKEAWNLLLQSHIQQPDWETLVQVLEDMRMHGINANRKSLSALHAHCLRLRQPGKRPQSVAVHQDDLRLVTNVFLAHLQAGRELHPLRWREVLRRFGMSGRFEELERLSLWLAAWYSPSTALERRLRAVTAYGVPPNPRDTASYRLKSLPSSHSDHPLRQIFDPSFQRAVVAWGFKTSVPSSAFSKSLKPPQRVFDSQDQAPTASEPWARGLALLAKLKHFGVLVQTSTVRKVVKQRLLMLYGPVRSSFRDNVNARAANPYTLEQMVRHAEALWSGTLFQLDPALLAPGTGSRADLLAALFGPRPLPRRLKGPDVACSVDTAAWASMLLADTHVAPTQPVAEGRQRGDADTALTVIELLRRARAQGSGERAFEG